MKLGQIEAQAATDKGAQQDLPAPPLTELAGLEVVRIVNEPTAASLVYEYADDGEPAPDSPYVLVYDLGGGTFDVSILKLNGDIREVLASCGDTALGGDDFDERLADHFARHLMTGSGFDARDGGQALRTRLGDIAEKVKIRLSDESVVRVAEVGLHIHNGTPLNLELEIDRREYEAMIGDLVDRTLDKVKEALHEASLDIDDIGRVILVGGATKTPMVMESLSELFDTPVTHSVDPDLCVALGASVQHGLIAGEPLGRILLDVTAHSLGIRTIDEVDYETGEADYFSVIIRRNTRIPARKSEMCHSSFQNQKEVKLEVLQGESHSCKENSLIGSFMFDLEPAPEGCPVIAELSYDRDGIIHVVVEQKGYGNRREVTMDARSCSAETEYVPVLDDEVVNYMVRKARRLAACAGLPEGLRHRLETAVAAYAAALGGQVGDAQVDDLEDALLEVIHVAFVASGHEHPDGRIQKAGNSRDVHGRDDGRVLAGLQKADQGTECLRRESGIRLSRRVGQGISFRKDHRGRIQATPGGAARSGPSRRKGHRRRSRHADDYKRSFRGGWIFPSEIMSGWTRCGKRCSQAPCRRYAAKRSGWPAFPPTRLRGSSR